MIKNDHSTLYLPLKKQWYDMIEAGIKNEEYREIKDYWTKRIKGGFETLYTNEKGHIVTHIKEVVFHNYTDKKMRYKVEHISVGRGKKEWGAPDFDVYIIKLGDKIN